MSEPITVTNGIHEVKIYTVRNRGRHVHQLSYYEGGQRKRKTLANVVAARREAKIVLASLASTALALPQLGTADLESYAIARRHVEPTGLPLHVCAELFAKAHARLTGRPLLEAVEFYVGLQPANVSTKTLAEQVEDFAENRQRRGVTAHYIANIRRQLGRLAADLPGRTLLQLRTAELDRWLGDRPSHPATKNDLRKIMIAFGNWAKAHGHLPDDRATPFDRMLRYKAPPTTVAVYTPAELGALFAAVAAQRSPLLPWLACAAYTGARVSELAHLRWEHINFERGFVEIASSKVRTKARRLVPLHEALRARLLPCRQDFGPINVYVAPQQALARLAEAAGCQLKANGFRHSYISYRLAAINDTARVALEAGNTPEVIFRHYRELVSPAEAAQWFSPELPTPARPDNVAAVQSA